MAGKKSNAEKRQNAAIKQLQAQVSQAKGKANSGGKKKKNSGNNVGAIVLRSDFSRAFLDPFSIRGARVPDGTLTRTVKGCTRYTSFGGAPKFNFGGTPMFQYVSAAPIPKDLAKPLVVASSNGAGVSWYDYTTNTAPTAWSADNSKPFIEVATGTQDPVGSIQSMRVTGGGVKLRFTNIPPTTPVEVYYIPKFNRDFHASGWEVAVARSHRHWRLSKDDSIVIPFPIRNVNDAFGFWASNRPGNEVDDYPRDDDFTATSQLRQAFVGTASTNCTTINTAVNAWSMQSGLGGICVAYKLPPGASVNVDSIIHWEAIPTQTIDAINTDVQSEMCLANSHQIDAVCNASAAIANSFSEGTTGSTTPLEDLRNLTRGATVAVASGALEGLEDSQFLTRLAQAAAVGAMGGLQYYARRRQLLN